MRIGHAGHSHRVGVPVEDECAPTTRATGTSDDIGAAGDNLLQAHIEPGATESFGNIVGNRSFAGATRYEIRIDRIDGDQIMQKLNGCIHGVRSPLMHAVHYLTVIMHHVVRYCQTYHLL